MLAATECCICRKKKTDASKSGYEILVKCITELSAKQLKTCCEVKKDLPLLSADLAGKDWEAIVAYEIQYHRSCYKNYTRGVIKATTVSDNTDAEIFQRVQNTVIVENRIMFKEDLVKIYNEIKHQTLSDARPLMDRLKEHFGGEISVFKPKYGKQFLYSEHQTKGEIIKTFIDKLEMAKDRGKSKITNKRQTVMLAAKYIRNEIKESPNTYDNWPPTSTQLF